MKSRPLETRPPLLLVHLNGVKQSKSGDYEIRDHYVRFTFKILKEDKLSFIAIGPDPWEFEVEVPYRYEAHTWFDPSNFHDPKTKKLEPPEPTVTQL